VSTEKDFLFFSSDLIDGNVKSVLNLCRNVRSQFKVRRSALIPTYSYYHRVQMHCRCQYGTQCDEVHRIALVLVLMNIHYGKVD